MLLQPLWTHRHRVFDAVRHLMRWLGESLAHLPLPGWLKRGARDGAMLAVELLVVRSETYQGWKRQGGAARALTGLEASAGSSQPARFASPAPVAPTREQWEELCARLKRLRKQPLLDVIIPVYRGYDATLNAIYHAALGRLENQTPYRVLVIDDASPEGDLSASLRSLSQLGAFDLMIHQENMGFAATVNQGMAQVAPRDVIILNADTEAYGRWVDRLHAAAQSAQDIATVTPLSNHADLCSYPQRMSANEAGIECDGATLDAMAARVNAGVTAPLPVGNGFCMYITRRALDAVGLLDVERFGAGYGEETDFCLRASRYGLRHLLACDVYVRHLGATSFGSVRRAKRIRRSGRLIAQLYPEYEPMLADALAEDSAAAPRRALDIARLSAVVGEAPFLMVSHRLGGGTQRHVDELMAALREQGTKCILMQPVAGMPEYVQLSAEGMGALPHLRFHVDTQQETLIESLRALGVAHIHLHHLAGFSPFMPEILTRMTQALGIAYDVTLHDYYPICPRVNLVTPQGDYCGAPDASICEGCVATGQSYIGAQPVWLWRQRHGALLLGARRVFAPSEDTAQRIRSHFSGVTPVVKAHPEVFDNTRPLDTTRQPHERLRIAVIGAITTDAKGQRVLAALVEDAQQRNLPLEYILIGHSRHPGLREAAGRPLRVSGPYRETELPRLLERYRPHRAFIPSIWPETYCYTLSIALRFGLRPTVFDMGAQAGRLRALGDNAGDILPLTLSEDARALNDWFQGAAKGDGAPPTPANVSYNHLLPDYYGMTTTRDKTP